MWNVVGPFEVGSPADLAVVLEAAQNQNRRYLLYPPEEDSEAQIAAIVADSVVVGEEERLAEGVEDFVEVEAASVADVMTLGVAGVAVGSAVAVADSGVYCVPNCPICD